MRVVGLLALASTIGIGSANVLLNAQATSDGIPLAKPDKMPAWQVAAGGHMEFEVASIKLSEIGKFRPPNIALNIDDEPIATGGRFFADFPLPVYVEFAYKLMLTREEREVMLAHLPKWVTSQPFVIEAKAPSADVTKDQMRLMMQSLLAERFKLSAHFETHELPAFALVTVKPGKTGRRLHPHSEGLACDAKWIAPADGSSSSVPPGGFMPHCGAVALLSGPNRTLILGSRDVTMNHLAQYLPTLIPFGRPIVDRTGLPGSFDFSLEFTPEQVIASNSAADVQPEPQGTTAFEALKEQLGLALKPIKAPMQALVIDHVEQPSPN